MGEGGSSQVWRISTYSNSGDCVEWRVDADSILVRNSKSPDQAIAFTYSEWRAFISGVKAGEADLPKQED